MIVQRIAPHLRDIHVPAPLRDRPLWCTWRYETYSGEPKPRKVPFYADGMRRHGQQGTPYDRARLVPFALALDAAVKRGMDGVGFAPMDDAGIVALDFDYCVKEGEVDPVVLDLISGTYAEYSPSGKGIRAFFTAAPDVLANRKSRAKDGLFGVEAFSSVGFVTVTGWMLDHVDLLGYEDRVAPMPQKVTDFCHSRFGAGRAAIDADDFMLGREPTLNLSVGEMEDLLARIDPDCGRDEWIRVGHALHHECEGDDTGLALWDEWSSNGAKYPGYEAVEYQWRSFRGPVPGRPSVTMASVIKMAKDADGRPSIATAEQLAEAVADVQASMDGATPPDFDGKFHIIRGAAAIDRPPLEWWIKGVMPKGDLGILFGASGSGKTFVALDLALALSQGTVWRGHRVQKARVLYIAAEGGGGLGKRLKARCRKYDIDPADVELSVMYAAPNIMDKEDITELLRAIRAAGDFDFIVVDTFAQVTPGANENAAEDMGHALANVRALREASGAMPLLVHHAGKDASKGSRGWSGLKAAADVQLEVIRHDNGAREIHLEKIKDGEDGLRWGFSLEIVELGFDEDGDPITSCVIAEAELPRPADPGDRKGLKRRGRIENHILELMADFGTADVVKVEELVQRAIATLPEPETGKRDTRRQHVIRALGNLSKEKDGLLQVRDNIVVFFE